MSDFETWPERSSPIGNAVFAQPFGEDSRKWLKQDLWPRSPFHAVDQDVKWGDERRLIEVIIDYEGSKFGYAFARPDEEGEHSAEFNLSPLWPHDHSPEWYAEGLCEWEPKDKELEQISHLSVDDSIATWRAVGATWREMVDSLNRRVQSGEVTLYARAASPLEKRVTAIPPDVWLHFEIIDWPKGVAFCRSSGDRLYSVHARERARASVAIIKRAATPSDVQALRDEIQRRFDAGEQKMKRPEMVSLLRARGVSRDSAGDAVNTIPSEHRRQPGERDGISLQMPEES